MDKFKVFLYADGLIVLLGAIFFVGFLLRRGNASQFRDDLWKENWKNKEAARQRARQEKVDREILLELDPLPGMAEGDNERTEPRLQGPAAAAPKGPRPGPASRPAVSLEFSSPNFRGKPHEILGIPAQADDALVGRAYKYWIKRYHPDRVTHLGPEYVEQARVRSEQLNGARQAMLQLLAQRKK